MRAPPDEQSTAGRCFETENARGVAAGVSTGWNLPNQPEQVQAQLAFSAP